MSVKKYTSESLEKIAEDFLKQYGQGKYDGRSLRIEALIESYGYQIFARPGLSEIAEAYIPAKSGYIFVDEEQYLNSPISFRWRFTIAKELAHLLIHRPIFEGKSAKQIEKIQEGISDEDYRIIEKNAKFLAGCILMPKTVFKERFAYFQAIQAQRKSTNTLKILRDVVRQISMDFNVSCYSVALRALSLKLIDQQQLDDLIQSFGW